jgi:asparagine synthase (glutamine-hydrolysing)
MCGIAGILNLDGRPCEADEVRTITRALAHRGPDGEGVYTDGPLGLGHRRLAILDLSEAGKQPMSCVGGRYWVSFNGEIYNFVELRKELKLEGYEFATQTDTEIIGAAYDYWGTDCVFKFNGMWAFAVWDRYRRQLFLSRDRFGVKPLHYLAEPRRFVFASELKAFPRLPDFTPRENEEAMRRALATATHEAVEETLLQGVRRLKAGHNLLVGASGTKVWRWWRTLDHVPRPPRSLADQAERFRELFFDACRLRLRSDVPVATCLSGGLDSSSVLCTLAAVREASRNAGAADRLTGDSHRAFVATFPGTLWDEREYAGLAIRKAEAEPRYRPITLEMATENLTRYAYDFEGISNSLLIPLWCIYRELRRDGVAVSLDGHGSDEMLGGYPQTLLQALAARGSLLLAPVRTLDLVRTLRGMYSSGTLDTRGLAGLLVNSDPCLRAASGLLRRARRAIRLGTTGATRGKPDAGWVKPWEDEHDFLDDDERSALESLGPLDRPLYLQFHHTVLPAILRNYDRCSMAHGVESRMPFMDWRLVCYVFGLPEASKVGGGLSKRVLREAMRGVLPEGIRTRKGKIGFVSPMPNWFNGGLGDFVWEQVSSPSFLEGGVWNGAAVRDFVAARRRTKKWTQEECKRVWRFVQAHLWRQAFLKKPTPPTLGPGGREAEPAAASGA